MRQTTAKTSLSIRLVTLSTLLFVVVLLTGSLFLQPLVYVGVLVGLVCLICYLLAPAAYEVRDGRLTVFFHLGKKEFAPVVRCSRITACLPFTIRLFGNGGLFAGTGIFWNRTYGVFRVYVTSARPTDFVLVETDRQKVVISPADPPAFVAAWEAANPPRNP